MSKRVVNAHYIMQGCFSRAQLLHRILQKPFIYMAGQEKLVDVVIAPLKIILPQGVSNVVPLAK